MKKKSIVRLLLLVTIGISLYSCVHDEVSLASDPSLYSKEYSSKSLWKEDEKYIENVKKVFDEYADKSYFAANAGQVAWNYALTAGEERSLEVPVIKNGKVNFILVAIREGDRVYFKRDVDENSRKFFDILVFKDRNSLLGTAKENTDHAQAKGCVTIEKTVTWTDTATGAVLQVDHFTTTHCTSGPYLPCEAIGMDQPCGNGGGGGMGGGGGGNGGGYPYPNDPGLQQFVDTCAKLKTQALTARFKEKVTDLDKDSIFNAKKEKGFASAYGPQTTYQQMQNTSDGNVQLPTGNKYFGYMHVHLNKEGVVKIFSPTDLATFLTSCVRNAKEKGNMTDAYAMVITSEGSYMLKYSGDGSYNIGPNQIANWNSWYKREYSELVANAAMTQTNVETIFAKFLEEKVNIEGLELYRTSTTAATAERLSLNPAKTGVAALKCP